MENEAETTQKRDQQPKDHFCRFARRRTPRTQFDRVVRMLAKDDKPATMVALFDNRASHHTIRDWRRGKLRAPAWAIELLRAKLSAPLAILDEIRR